MNKLSTERPGTLPKWRGLGHFSVSGTALAAGVLLLFQEQLPVASAIPLTKSTPLEAKHRRERILTQK